MAIKTLKNVTLKWCKFGTVDDYGKYSCQISLSTAQAEQVAGWGLKTKQDEDGNYFIRVRRDEDRGPVVVKDAALNVITANIANGAIANVMLDVFEYKKFGGGIACRIEKVQVLVWDIYGDDADFEEVSDSELPTVGGSNGTSGGASSQGADDGGSDAEAERLF